MRNIWTIARREYKLNFISPIAYVVAFLILISLLTYDAYEDPATIGSAKTNNKLGIVGVYISHYLITYVLGYASLVFPVIVFLIGLALFRGKNLLELIKPTGYLVAFAIYASVILALPESLNPIMEQKLTSVILPMKHL